MCVDSSTDTKNASVRCQVLGVRFQVSGVMCHVSPVTCHISLTATATAKDPPLVNWYGEVAWVLRRKNIFVRQGSRKSAPGVKEKCFSWIPHIQQKHFSLTPDALLLDPWRTSPWPPTHFSLTPDALLLDPWRTSPWPGGPIFQSWKQQKIGERKIRIYFWKRFIS